MHLSPIHNLHCQWIEILPAKIGSALVSAVFLPNYNPWQSLVEPRALSPIPMCQGKPDEALVVLQHQLVDSRPGIQCLLDAPNNDGQQVATSFRAQNLSSVLLV